MIYTYTPHSRLRPIKTYCYEQVGALSLRSRSLPPLAAEAGREVCDPAENFSGLPRFD